MFSRSRNILHNCRPSYGSRARWAGGRGGESGGWRRGRPQGGWRARLSCPPARTAAPRRGLHHMGRAKLPIININHLCYPSGFWLQLLEQYKKDKISHDVIKMKPADHQHFDNDVVGTVTPAWGSSRGSSTPKIHFHVSPSPLRIPNILNQNSRNTSSFPSLSFRFKTITEEHKRDPKNCRWSQLTPLTFCSLRHPHLCYRWKNNDTLLTLSARP